MPVETGLKDGLPDEGISFDRLRKENDEVISLRYRMYVSLLKFS